MTAPRPTPEERFLGSLAADDEAFAIMSDDTPLTIDRVFFNEKGPSCWWLFDAQSRYVSHDPVKHHKDLSVNLRSVVLWGRAGDLLVCKHRTDRPALARAMARIQQLCAGRAR